MTAEQKAAEFLKRWQTVIQTGREMREQFQRELAEALRQFKNGNAQ